MSKKPKNKTQVLREEDEFKAVLIADSFDEKFGPLYTSKPKALFPLATIPMIDYSLSVLESSKFDEVYIISCQLSTQLREYINSSKWASSNMKVTIIPLDSCMSVGDCLRDLDAKALIRNNFILIGADTITNISLKPMLDDLKSKIVQDKGCVMTVIMRKTSVNHMTRSAQDDIIVFKDLNTGKILNYQKNTGKKSLSMPLFKESVDVCYDLFNSQICACSPTVLSLFAENFDYQTIDDFIRGIIMNEEILGNSIYLHTVESGYAAKVTNLHMYSAISYDVMGRWPYPFVPDVLADLTYLKHDVYKGKDVILQRGCEVKENVVLGQSITVGKDSIITDSVIGNNCKIGTNVKIEGAFIWDNVTIEDGCEVLKSVLSENVIIRQQTVINNKCVIGSNVHVGPSINLPEKTILAEKLPNDEFGDEVDGIEVTDYDHKLIGSEGQGYLYKSQAQLDDDPIISDLAQDLWNVDITSDEDDDLSSISSRFSESEEEYDEVDGAPLHEDVRSFCEEVLDSLLRGVEENISCDNLILEINSSKYAYNITIQEVNTHLISSILSIPLVDKKDATVAEYFSKLRTLFTQFLPLLKNYIKSNESQMDCLYSIEDFMVSRADLNGTTVKILHFLYERDILNEDNIVEWHENPKEAELGSVEKKKEIRKLISKFIHWLKEAEEESESEEDSDEE